MSVFLMPISIFIKHYITFTGNMYLSQVIVYLFGTLAMFSGYRNRHQINIRSFVNGKICLFMLLIIAMQFIAMINSYHRYGTEEYIKSPLRVMVSLLVFLFLVFFHYIIIKLLVISEKDIKYFVKGVYISILIILITTYAQQLYLLFPNSIILNKIMTFIGAYFEARDPGANPWYAGGSLVQTLKRINGFFTESAMLAGHIAIICLPFVLAAIKNQYNVFNLNNRLHQTKYHILLVLLLGMLLLAKTSTGILAIAVAMIVFWIMLPWKHKLIYGAIFAVLMIFTFYLYQTNSYVNNILYTYIFGKTNSFSTDNRLGNTIGLLITFIQHPFLGTGYGYTYHYLITATPEWSTHNSEFNEFINVRHSIPILSIFSGWLAQYGTIIVTLFVAYIVKLEWSLYHLVKQHKNSTPYLLYKTIIDASLLFFLIFLPLSFFNFGWNESSFLIMFFFFVAFRQYLYQITTGGSVVTKNFKFIRSTFKRIIKRSNI